MMNPKAYTLVAHRGYPKHYPENSLPGIEAALKAGAKAIEFDIQFSADAVPIVFHDETLMRVSGVAGKIWETPYSSLQTLKAAESKRFGRQFEHVSICSLAQLCEQLSEYPKVEIFVEIKQHSISAIGIETAVNTVLNTIKPIAECCIITSFNKDVLEYSQRTGFKRTAWVINSYNEQSRMTATELQPDFLVCNYLKLPKTKQAMWPGNWRWMVYTIDTAEQAQEFADLGADYIETDDIGTMLSVADKADG